MNTLKFKLTIAYDGTGYEGWQMQKTGTGVHALGMVAHFEIPHARNAGDGAHRAFSYQELSLLQ